MFDITNVDLYAASDSSSFITFTSSANGRYSWLLSANASATGRNAISDCDLPLRVVRVRKNTFFSNVCRILTLFISQYTHNTCAYNQPSLQQALAIRTPTNFTCCRGAAEVLPNDPPPVIASADRDPSYSSLPANEHGHLLRCPPRY